MRAPSALAVMARYPALGEVKTRLARRLGAARAATLYRAFLQDIELRFAAGPRPLLWVFSPPHADFAALLAPGARCIPQAGADLGARLHHCFRTLCGEGSLPRHIGIGGSATGTNSSPKPPSLGKRRGLEGNQFDFRSPLSSQERGPGGEFMPEETLSARARESGEGFERVIVFGADIPHLRDEWLDETEHALQDHDVVLGPAEDGGYYLIAMRAAHDLFTGIEMSTDRVLAQTLDKAARAGLRAHLLPESFDVDEARDLVQLRRLLAREGNGWLPHTAAALAQYDLEEFEGR